LPNKNHRDVLNGEHRGAKLGGGFKYFLLEMIPFDEYFSDGLVQPPTSKV